MKDFVLAEGAFDLSTVPGGPTLAATASPMVYDSEGDCFYCISGKLGELKAKNLSRPLVEFINDGEWAVLRSSTDSKGEIS